MLIASRLRYDFENGSLFVSLQFHLKWRILFRLRILSYTKLNFHGKVFRIDHSYSSGFKMNLTHSFCFAAAFFYFLSIKNQFSLCMRPFWRFADAKEQVLVNFSTFTVFYGGIFDSNEPWNEFHIGRFGFFMEEKYFYYKEIRQSGDDLLTEEIFNKKFNGNIRQFQPNRTAFIENLLILSPSSRIFSRVRWIVIEILIKTWTSTKLLMDFGRKSITLHE